MVAVVHGWAPSDAVAAFRQALAERFSGKLPYLFKVLSAAVPLSIQAHPTRQQALAGFARAALEAQIEAGAQSVMVFDTWGGALTPRDVERMTAGMVERGYGRCVYVASTAGDVAEYAGSAYTAAKHGLIGYMDALRSEVSVPHNIQVTNVLPGSVATDVSRNAVTEDGYRRGKSDANIDAGDDPMDCARAILDAVENNVPELIFAKGMELDLARMRRGHEAEADLVPVVVRGAEPLGVVVADTRPSGVGLPHESQGVGRLEAAVAAG